jgi:hypothetical protein
MKPVVATLEQGLVRKRLGRLAAADARSLGKLLGRIIG